MKKVQSLKQNRKRNVFLIWKALMPKRKIFPKKRPNLKFGQKQKQRFIRQKPLKLLLKQKLLRKRKLLLKQKLLQKQLPNRKRKPILRAVILKRKVKQIRLLNLKQSLKRNLKQSLQRTLQNYKTLWKNSTPLPTPSL